MHPSIKRVVAEGPIFEGTTRTGKRKFHRVLLVTDGKQFGIAKQWWQDGSVVQTSVPRWAKPRSQQTSEAQARFEFDSAIRRKTERRESGFTKPMLAQKFSERKDAVTWPVYVQPKYDGHRMLMDGERAWTRGQKEHKATVDHLIFDTDGYILDGEVMLPKSPKLQESSSAIKGKVGAASKTLHYYVYDVVSDLPYSKRLEILKELEWDFPENVVLAPTAVATDANEVMELHDKYVAQGFEGAIVRTDGTGYEIGERTTALLKVKEFQDEEFQVVSVDDGKGSNVGLAILVFDAGNGKQFRAVPEGGHDLRAKLWKNRHDLLGQTWTVRYFYKSKEGIPVFPVAVAEREEGE